MGTGNHKPTLVELQERFEAHARGEHDAADALAELNNDATRWEPTLADYERIAKASPSVRAAVATAYAAAATLEKISDERVKLATAPSGARRIELDTRRGAR